MRIAERKTLLEQDETRVENVRADETRTEEDFVRAGRGGIDSRSVPDLVQYEPRRPRGA